MTARKNKLKIRSESGLENRPFPGNTERAEYFPPVVVENQIDLFGRINAGNHEINNMLMTILGSVQILMSKPDTDLESLMAKLKTIEQSARIIASITENRIVAVGDSSKFGQAGIDGWKPFVLSILRYGSPTLVDLQLANPLDFESEAATFALKCAVDEKLNAEFTTIQGPAPGSILTYRLHIWMESTATSMIWSDLWYLQEVDLDMPGKRLLERR